jgi:hypothetical protein
MAVAITRKELGARERRREAVRGPEASAARRRRAWALVLEGHAREAAARHTGMDRQTRRSIAARATGASRPRARARRLGQPAPCRAEATAHARAEGGTGTGRRARTGPGAGRRGARAAGRPPGADQGPLRRRSARALGRQGPAPARLRPPVGAAQAPLEPARGAGNVQKASVNWCRRRCPSPRKANRSRSGAPMVERAAFNGVGQQGTSTRIGARRGTRPRAPRATRRLGFSVRRGRSPDPPRGSSDAPRGRRRAGAAVRRPGSEAPASAGDRPAGRAGRPRRSRLGRRRRARSRRAGGGSPQPHPAAAAAVCARARSGGESLAIPAAEPAPPAGLAGRPGDRRDLLPSLERADGHAREDRLHHPPGVGQTGHRLGPLVSAGEAALDLRAEMMVEADMDLLDQRGRA